MDTLTEPMTYDGADIGLIQIKSGTNPWVEVDGKPVDWTTSTLPRVPCGCEDFGGVIVPGVIDSMDTDEGIQRCDECNLFPGDLDAALALAAVVGGVVRFTPDPDTLPEPPEAEPATQAGRTYGDLYA